MRARRWLEDLPADIGHRRAVGDRRPERGLRALGERGEALINERRRPLADAQRDAELQRDRVVTLAVQLHVVGLVVRDQVRAERQHAERRDYRQAEDRAAAPQQLAPDARASALLPLTHAFVPAKVMRGSTTASKRSASRIPSWVRATAAANSASTTG